MNNIRGNSNETMGIVGNEIVAREVSERVRRHKTFMYEPTVGSKCLFGSKELSGFTTIIFFVGSSTKNSIRHNFL